VNGTLGEGGTPGQGRTGADPDGAGALAHTAAALLAVDPPGLGGACVRARPGPHFDQWLAHLRSLLGDDVPFRRLPARMDPGRLTGELDVVETLRTGHRSLREGILARHDGGLLHIPMAERMDPEVATLLAQLLDTGALPPRIHGLDPVESRVGLLLIDESSPDESGAPAILMERLGLLFTVDPGVGGGLAGAPAFAPEDVLRARSRLPEVTTPPELARAATGAAMELGIPSLRAPVAALRVARIHAALEDRAQVTDDDLAMAACLVLLPRATRLPSPPPPSEDEEASPPPPPPPSDGESPDGDDPEAGSRPLADRVLEAAKARLPQDLELILVSPSTGRAGRRGALIRQLKDGHRIGARPGDPRREGRIDLSATLRAAAPWQPVRRQAQPDAPARILVRPSDLHVQLRARHSATATVFLVDASGSQALNRLAEVKGAVELLLADSYVRREEVALVTFRGRDAEVILPPTRSLVRARRALAGLPGGGGTPLARGLLEGLGVARRLRSAEATPRLVLLSDGRPNVDREGEGGRSAARADALAAARLVADEAIPLLVLDTSVRGERFAGELARAGGGRHLHLPRADARTVRAAIGTLDSQR